MPIEPSLKILVVDDVPAVRSVLKNMLEQMGFTQIIEAEDGETAWQLIQQASTQGGLAFELVISDWNMPGMSGADLLRAVRSFPPSRDLPFLMVTAEGDHGYLSEAIRAGVTDYVVKPFNGAQLGEKIAEVFGVGN